jgi:ribosomal protein S13
LSENAQTKLIQRFELNFYKIYNKKLFSELPLNQRKIINMYLSQIISINSNIFELIKFEMIRLYLIKTFRGRCFALGKPSRGQRT